MCIIMYAPSGIGIEEKKIRQAFENNPDGAGVMWYDDTGYVHYRKGFDKVDELVSFFVSLGREFPRAVHCRIATSGKIGVRTCHPFPIVEKVDDMGDFVGKPKFGAVMHNGIFSRYTPTGGMKADYSDTMNYVSKVIYPIVSAGCIENEGVIRLLGEMTSRLLVFLPNFIVGRFGSWEEDKEEHFFASNDTYSHKKYVYVNPYINNGYGCNYTNYSGYDADWWKKRGSRTPACTETKTTVIRPVTKKSENKTHKKKTNGSSTPIKKTETVKSDKKNAEYLFSIGFSATDKQKANDLFYDFLDEYYEYILEDDKMYDSLQEIGKDLWEFYFNATCDIDRIKKVSKPYFISYFEKLKED